MRLYSKRPEASMHEPPQPSSSADRPAGSAAEALVERTYRQVYAALVRMCGDPDEAADLTQETYRKAWQGLAEFRGEAELATWLYRIAYTTFLNARRRPRLVVAVEDPGAGLADPEPSPAERALTSERATRLRRAVLALPEELRFAVSAHYWGELSLAEIGRLEGISGPAVGKRLARALAAIEAAMAAPGEEAR
jgi:RNA polymerase sigma factor (sigma-70 family)